MEQELKFTGSSVKLTMTLTDKHIIENIAHVKKQIEINATEATKIEAMQPKTDAKLQTHKDNIVVLNEKLDEINKFVGWANEAQLNKARVIVRDNMEELLKSIDKDFVRDENEDSNTVKVRKYELIQRKLATLPITVESIEQNNVKKFFFTEPIFTNPWLSDDVQEQKD